MTDWKFNSVMNCDKCKFNHQCNMEPDCPYLQGWTDGQRKMLAYQIKEWSPLSFPSAFVNRCEQMLKELTMDKSIKEANDGKLIYRGSFAKYVKGK